MKMFIDDERMPPGDEKEWHIVRSFDEGRAFVIEHGIPDFISFDHDLGTGLTGYDFTKWLIECHLDGLHRFPKDFDFYVHSMNPIGAENIRQAISSFLEHINVND